MLSRGAPTREAEHFIRFELPMDRGWGYCAWIYENDGWMQFNQVARKGDGYVRQEVRKLMEMVKHGKQH